MLLGMGGVVGALAPLAVAWDFNRRQEKTAESAYQKAF
jgi:hypothetical protein